MWRRAVARLKLEPERKARDSEGQNHTGPGSALSRLYIIYIFDPPKWKGFLLDIKVLWVVGTKFLVIPSHTHLSSDWKLSQPVQTLAQRAAARAAAGLPAARWQAGNLHLPQSFGSQRSATKEYFQKPLAQKAWQKKSHSFTETERKFTTCPCDAFPESFI